MRLLKNFLLEEVLSSYKYVVSAQTLMCTLRNALTESQKLGIDENFDKGFESLEDEIKVLVSSVEKYLTPEK